MPAARAGFGGALLPELTKIRSPWAGFAVFAGYPAIALVAGLAAFLWRAA